jgi:hypothetical protein
MASVGAAAAMGHVCGHPEKLSNGNLMHLALITAWVRG